MTLEQVTHAAGVPATLADVRNMRRANDAHEALAVALRAMVQAPTLDALLSDVVSR